jgi:hypothetical protein
VRSAWDLLVVAQLMLSSALCGLIWTIQRVHYPALAFAEPARFSVLHALHTERITTIVGPLMLAELAAALALPFVAPTTTPRAPLLLGLALLLCVWAVTAFVSVPLHAALARGFDADVHAALVRTNWWRTGAWTLRLALASWLAITFRR